MNDREGKHLIHRPTKKLRSMAEYMLEQNFHPQTFIYIEPLLTWGFRLGHSER